MRDFWRSTWIRVGLALLVFGSGPLAFIGIAVVLGLWPDPNPNPVGPGILMALTLWPAILCIAIGLIRVLWRRARTKEP
jgi:hypothetical protein